MCDTRVLPAESVILPLCKRLAPWGWVRGRSTALRGCSLVDELRADAKKFTRYPAWKQRLSGAPSPYDAAIPGDGRVRKARYSLVAVSSLLVIGLLAGCGTTPARDFGGRWKPVNRFAQAPTEIPLYSSYVFQASPTDRTLKTMLERWTFDTGLVLDYRLTSDYTLYGPLAALNTTSAREAASKVTSAYATQGLSVSVVGNALTVSRAGQSPDETTSPPGS